MARRTTHGSTHSFVTHAGVLARYDSESAWKRFLVALRSDVEVVRGGTTKEGIHMGAMSGSVDVKQRAYPGMCSSSTRQRRRASPKPAVERT
jgi:trehalose/maltose hydrolase-like predicted phosphorylase